VYIQSQSDTDYENVCNKRTCRRFVNAECVRSHTSKIPTIKTPPAHNARLLQHYYYYYYYSICRQYVNTLQCQYCNANIKSSTSAASGSSHHTLNTRLSYMV